MFMDSAEGDGDDEPRMYINDVPALGQSEDKPLCLVSIFGAARQGKSFLMNNLAQQEGLFNISNSREPCTQVTSAHCHPRGFVH